MIRATLLICIALAAGAVFSGYSTVGAHGAARLALLLGLAWLLAGWRRWRWAASTGLLIVVVTSGVGLVLGVPFAWMMAATVFALLAWDLAEFGHRLRLASAEDDLSGLERRHLLRLSVLSLGAVGLASLGMRLDLRLSFEWVLVLAVAAALFLVNLVRALRRPGQG